MVGSDSKPSNLNSHSNSSSNSDILHKFLFFNVHKDGHINIFNPRIEYIPPADDPLTGVKIKDVQITTNLAARLFLPPPPSTTAKLPTLVYAHGGGFCMRSTFSSEYTAFLTTLSATSGVLIVSVEYGLFPSNPIPVCYDDTWTALLWTTTNPTSDPWLTHHADVDNLFIGGTSAGGNICHTVAVRAAEGGVKVAGMIMIHPYFGEDDKMWMYMCPSNEGPMDPRMKPALEDLARIECGRVVVFVAGNDPLRVAGVRYAEELKKSGWKGCVEVVENKDREHSFYLSQPHDEEANAIQLKIASFIIGNY